VPLELLTSYELYRREVWKVTNNQPIDTLKNFEKRGRAGKMGAHHLDHMISIIFGFLNGISPEMIGNINNLTCIPWEENVKKQGLCTITVAELAELINYETH
jgi:hypothetical protein